MQKLLFVGLGGFLGASLRYGLTMLSVHMTGGSTLVGTLACNIIGGFLIGLILHLTPFGNPLPEAARLFLVTGILGGFTTFSAFSYETVSLLDNGQVLRAGLYAAASVFLSLLAVFGGKAASALF